MQAYCKEHKPQVHARMSLPPHLDALVREAGGRLCPAKDARMTAEDFQRFYAEWETFQQYIDPAFSSSFWRRVTGS